MDKDWKIISLINENLQKWKKLSKLNYPIHPIRSSLEYSSRSSLKFRKLFHLQLLSTQNGMCKKLRRTLLFIGSIAHLPHDFNLASICQIGNFGNWCQLCHAIVVKVYMLAQQLHASCLMQLLSSTIAC